MFKEYHPQSPDCYLYTEEPTVDHVTTYITTNSPGQ